jgi:hypothetical protein
MESTFNPTEHLSSIKGKAYLEVKWRLVWFRQDKPNWRIQTKIVDQFENGAVFKAVILDENNNIMASGHKMETRTGFPDYLEKAETGAIGRALAMCGYGTQFAPELEEGERIVDAPIETRKGGSPASNTTPAQTNNNTTEPSRKCEMCGSDMWDNRNNKKNPKQPDYKCKDSICGHAVWIK